LNIIPKNNLFFLKQNFFCIAQSQNKNTISAKIEKKKQTNKKT
jgi:hypothetical protein